MLDAAIQDNLKAVAGTDISPDAVYRNVGVEITSEG